jgi:outer membrane protein TolC
MVTLKFEGLSAIVVSAMACLTAARAADTLTLDQAIATAVEHNRTLRNSAADIAKAQNRLKAHRTRQFPNISVYMLGAQQLQSFDFTLEKGVLGTYSGIGLLPAEDVHLKSPLEPTGIFIAKVAQPLSSLIRIRRSLDALKTGVAIAEEESRAGRQTIVREVKRVYYGLQQVESSLRSVRQTLELYRELARLTENYVAGQVVLKADLLEVQARLAKTEQSESLLRDQQASGKERLNQLLGRDVLIDFEVQPVLEAAGETVDLEAARMRAAQQRPELRQAVLREKQAEQDLRAKRAESIPEVAAEFNSMSFLNFGRYFPVRSNSVGISLTWEPFDWGRKKHEAAEKHLAIEQARNTRQDAFNSVLIEVNEKFRQLRQSRTQLRVTRMAQETAIENLRVIKNRYAVQNVLLKDVLERQVSLEESNTEYRQALLSFWNARADFERALGEDL